MSKDNTSLGGEEIVDPGLEAAHAVKPREGMDNIIANAKKQREIDGTAPGESMQIYGDTEVPAENNDESQQINVDPLQNAIKVTAKVDGQSFEVDAAEVEAAGGINAYQRERSAQNKLDKAKQVLQQAREDGERIKKQAIADAQVEIDLAKNLTSQQTSGDDLSAAAVVALLYSGDEEKAEKAVRNMQQRGQPQASVAIDTNRIVAEATQKAIWEVDRRDANKLFKESYSDLDANQVLRNEVNQETAQLKQLHPEWGPRQIIEAAADTVRDRHHDFLSKTQSQKPVNMDDRLAQKRAMDNVKPANATVQQKQEPKRLTPSEVVANMNRQRGM